MCCIVMMKVCPESKNYCALMVKCYADGTNVLCCIDESVR